MPFHTNGKPKGYKMFNNNKKKPIEGGFKKLKNVGTKKPKVNLKTLIKKPKKKIKDY